jgi:hypothetical protein
MKATSNGITLRNVQIISAGIAERPKGEYPVTRTGWKQKIADQQAGFIVYYPAIKQIIRVGRSVLPPEFTFMIIDFILPRFLQEGRIVLQLRSSLFRGRYELFFLSYVYGKPMYGRYSERWNARAEAD